jgi:hypothetical protein
VGYPSGCPSVEGKAGDVRGDEAAARGAGAPMVGRAKVPAAGQAEVPVEGPQF